MFRTLEKSGDWALGLLLGTDDILDETKHPEFKRLKMSAESAAERSLADELSKLPSHLQEDVKSAAIRFCSRASHLVTSAVCPPPPNPAQLPHK